MCACGAATLQRLTRTVTMFGEKRGNRYTIQIDFKEYCQINGPKHCCRRDTRKTTTSDGLSTMTDGREGLDPIKIQETITEYKPVVLRTRTCRQQTAPIRINDDNEDLFRASNLNRNKDSALLVVLHVNIGDVIKHDNQHVVQICVKKLVFVFP